MRDMLSLQQDWWVSVSLKDAELAARANTLPPAAQLEYVSDDANLPQRIALPGGTQYGKRPLTEPGKALPQPQAVTEAFVGPLPGTDARGHRLPSPFLTYSRTVAVPATWARQRVFLTLDNARYHVTAWVNGQQAAHYVGGLEPHRVDVTAAIKPGTDNLLTITVGDSGTSGHRRFDPYTYTGTRLPTCKEIENNLVHPVNYGGANRGVSKVCLEAVPAVRTEYVFADPKVAKGLLCYTVVLVNDTDSAQHVRILSEAYPHQVSNATSASVGATPAVMDTAALTSPATLCDLAELIAVAGASGPAKQLVDEAVTIPARSRTTLKREVSWPDAILWDTDNPHLYGLKTILTDGATLLDVHTDAFGFREFTINGHSFYLNGRKIHLHGQSGHTDQDHDMLIPLEEKMRILREWKEKGNVVHIRLHAKPQDKGWVEAADRVGMLITTETALWTTGFHSFDWAGSEDACYENVRQHFLEALVRRDRNNPSVIIWSLSNEMSPITPADLENPKMAAMTRVFKRILAETAAEDSSRVVQMSSAMDFLGNLRMYNLHYPKNWQAFPDYPHTAYWLDKSFLFPWYGPKRFEMPSWGWRKDKPLYFGEFTCVFGATPDNQASIVGDIAFEKEDFGTALVDEKLWPLEIHSYRRLDVSGFCAWACMCFTSHAETLKTLALPHVQAHTHALRPLATLCHTYRSRWFAADEVALELSIHNDTRNPLTLELLCEVLDGETVLWTERMPPAVYGPAENRAFTNRFRAPQAPTARHLVYRATLKAGGSVVDRWEKNLVIAPKAAAAAFPATCGVYDADGTLAALFAARGIAGAAFIADLGKAKTLAGFRTLWVNFGQAKLHAREWQRVRTGLDAFVRRGGCVVLDNPPEFTWADLPVKLKNGKGYADGRLEITYAYGLAPQHPILQGLADADFSLWGADYYIARRCFEVPQEGNAMPLLVAGTDRGGLTSTPLLELAAGRGAYVVSTLEILPKLLEEPRAVDFLSRMATYHPQRSLAATVGAAVTADTLRACREVGFGGAVTDSATALGAKLALIDGEAFDPANDLGALKRALSAGKRVLLHNLGVAKTQAVLATLKLPGTVTDGKAKEREFDTVRHAHPLADGLTSNYLYWIVNKAKVAAWTLAPLHPEPASALIKLEPGTTGAASLTRRGAVVVYTVGKGCLVIDNLHWQNPGFDEPERPRRYVMTLLTNLGVPLAEGTAKRMSEEFETEAERRERGHF